MFQNKALSANHIKTFLDRDTKIKETYTLSKLKILRKKYENLEKLYLDIKLQEKIQRRIFSYTDKFQSAHFICRAHEIEEICKHIKQTEAKSEVDAQTLKFYVEHFLPKNEDKIYLIQINEKYQEEALNERLQN